MKSESLGLFLTKLILSVSLIVAFGALIGATVYLVKYRPSSNPVVAQNPEISPSITPASTPLLDETDAEGNIIPGVLAKLMLEDAADLETVDTCKDKKDKITFGDYDFNDTLIDLNADGENEIIVYPNTLCESFLGGMRNSSSFIYQKISGKWKKIGVVGVYNGQPEVSIGNTSTDGYKDLYSSTSSGSDFYSSNNYKWNKSKSEYEEISSDSENNYYYNTDEEAAGKDYENDVNNWNQYYNYKYGFYINYPLDENINFNDYADSLYNVEFKNFAIYALENPNGLVMKDFLTSNGFCTSNKSLCLSSSKAALLKTKKINDQQWFYVSGNDTVMYTATSDGNNIIIFDLNKTSYKNSFDKVLATFGVLVEVAE